MRRWRRDRIRAPRAHFAPGARRALCSIPASSAADQVTESALCPLVPWPGRGVGGFTAPEPGDRKLPPRGCASALTRSFVFPRLTVSPLVTEEHGPTPKPGLDPFLKSTDLFMGAGWKSHWGGVCDRFGTRPPARGRPCRAVQPAGHEPGPLLAPRTFVWAVN